MRKHVCSASSPGPNLGFLTLSDQAAFIIVLPVNHLEHKWEVWSAALFDRADFPRQPTQSAVDHPALAGPNRPVFSVQRPADLNHGAGFAIDLVPSRVHFFMGRSKTVQLRAGVSRGERQSIAHRLGHYAAVLVSSDRVRGRWGKMQRTGASRSCRRCCVRR